MGGGAAGRRRLDGGSDNNSRGRTPRKKEEAPAAPGRPHPKKTRSGPGQVRGRFPTCGSSKLETGVPRNRQDGRVRPMEPLKGGEPTQHCGNSPFPDRSSSLLEADKQTSFPEVGHLDENRTGRRLAEMQGAPAPSRALVPRTAEKPGRTDKRVRRGRYQPVPQIARVPVYRTTRGLACGAASEATDVVRAHSDLFRRPYTGGAKTPRCSEVIPSRWGRRVMANATGDLQHHRPQRPAWPDR